MKKIYLITIVSFLFVNSRLTAQNIGVSDVTNTPKASAVLDVYSTSKGMLIPRIALTSTTTAAPITSPEASLLIYNTATTGDVTPGYYYWNGSTKWVRFVASSDPRIGLNVVPKSADATLLKTETMVMASGDITLTLPTITESDNGLEITIKNVGTYMDLITIVPEAGMSIDANSYTSLTRWQGRTFVANLGNWIIKDKYIDRENLLDVSTTGSFASIAEVVEFLGSHMNSPVVVRIGAGTYPIDVKQTINLPYPVTFQGLSYGETTIEATSGVADSPLFTCETECYFKMLKFTAFSNAPGNEAIQFTGSEIYYEVKDSYFVGFNKAIVSMNNNDLWIFETDFEDCADAGIEIAAGSASDGFLKMSECDFMACGRGVNLLSGVSETVSIINCTFYNTVSSNEIGIDYTANDFSFVSMFITNNAWNNEGFFTNGFDFSLSSGRDANIFMINNAGMESKNPHCKLNVKDNAVTTTVTTANNYYKAKWSSNTSSYACKFTLGSSSPTSGNRITYQPKNEGDVWAVISGDISVDNSNRVITVAIVKNGVTSDRYGETDLRITTANQPFQFSTVIYIPEMNENDYLELYVTSANSGDVVKFRDIQWFANTQ